MTREDANRMQSCVMPLRKCRKLVLTAFLTGWTVSWAQTPAQWKAHDMDRPRPPKVTPSLALPVPPPSDAQVLFDGSGLSKWRSPNGAPAKWVLRDGYMESVKGSGYLYTADSFGDVQLHIEWATPTPPEGRGQGRGNSGVFLMGLYEVQVLDSYDNDTYADGQAAAVYGQHPPLVNASRPPGEWQSYDIVFRRPRFSRDGALLKAARMTVLHNGVLVQDNVEIWGGTSWLQYDPYKSHPDRLPLSLQDHGNPVRYRNIWVRELPEWTSAGPVDKQAEPVVTLVPSVLERYVGRYQDATGRNIIIARDGASMRASILGRPNLDVLVHSTEEFSLRWTAGRLVFDLNSQGEPLSVTFHIGRARFPAKKVD